MTRSLLQSLRFSTLCIPHCRLHCWLYSDACCTDPLAPCKEGPAGGKKLCSPPRLTTQPPVNECKPPRRPQRLCDGLLTDEVAGIPTERTLWQKDVTSGTPGQDFRNFWLDGASVRTRGCRALAGSPCPPTPSVTQSCPLGDPKSWHAISSVYASTLVVWAAKTSFMFSLTQASVLPTGELWIWIQPLQIHIPSPLKRQQWTHFSWKKKDTLEVSLCASCLFAVLWDFLGNDTHWQHS